MTPDEVELTRRRLEEQVKAKVEGDLFRTYRNVGSVALATLAAVGIFIGWPQLKALIVDQVAVQVEEQVSAPVQAAKAATAEAEKTAREAERIAGDVLARLEDRQAEIKEDIGRIVARFQDVSVEYGTAKSRLDAINDELDGLSQAVAYFRDLAKRDPVGRAEIEDLKQAIAEVAQRAGELAKTVAETETGPAGGAGAVQKEFEQVAMAQNDALAARKAATATDPRLQAKVFVQYEGGDRKDVEQVSDALRRTGWTVPAEQRLGAASGKREIRYFYDGDRNAALLLERDYNAALRQAGFSLAVAAAASPTAVKDLPARGVLEVWVDVPPGMSR